MSYDRISNELNNLIAAQQGVRGIARMLIDKELDHQDVESLGYALDTLADAIQRQTNGAMDEWDSLQAKKRKAKE